MPPRRPASRLGAPAVPLAILALVLVPSPARADEVVLTDGRRIEGELVSEGAAEVRLRVARGSLVSEVSFPRALVAAIERGPTRREVYAERAAAARADRFADQLALAEWCGQVDLREEAARHYAAAWELRNDSRIGVALRELGWVLDGGRWVTEAESHGARGYARDRGARIDPAYAELLRRRETTAKQLEAARRSAMRADRELGEAREDLDETARRVAVSKQNVAERDRLARGKATEVVAETVTTEMARDREAAAVLPGSRAQASRQAREAEADLARAEAERARRATESKNARRQLEALERQQAEQRAAVRRCVRADVESESEVRALERELARIDAEIARHLAAQQDAIAPSATGSGESTEIGAGKDETIRPGLPARARSKRSRR